MLLRGMRKRTVISLVLVMGLLLQCMPLIASAAGNSVQPVAQWKFDEGEGTIAVDTSGNGFDGIIHGANWVREGFEPEEGHELFFDGKDYVEVPHHNALNPRTALTVEAWIRPEALMQDWQKIICKSTGKDTDYSIIGRSDNRVGFSIKIGNVAQTAYSKYPISLHYATHVVGTYDGKKLCIYINGKLENSFAVTGCINDHKGVLRIGGDTVNANFYGAIDEVNIYPRALSAAEVLNRYEAELPDPGEMSLVAKWSFDEGEGESTEDSGGLEFHGSIVGATWTTGKIGSALYFDGNDFVQTSARDWAGALYPGRSVTVEAWIKPTAPMKDWQKIICKNSGTKTDYSIIARKDNRIGFSVKMGDVAQTAYSTTPIPLNQWTHVVGTYDGTKLCLYLNGQLVNAFPLTGRINNNFGALWIGGDSLANVHFVGVIDEVCVYERALTAYEILGRYNATK